MPQLQLPIFPSGVTEINNQIAVQNQAGTVYYLYGHVPVFHHAQRDVRGFRMFTSQMIVNGTVKPQEVLERAQQLLEAGQSVPAVARELKVLGNTLHKAIRVGRLRKKKNPPPPPAR
jgi:hypothetical protein